MSLTLGIVGTRTFDDYEFLESELNKRFPRGIDCVVSGGARGADALAKNYAINHNIPYKEFPAEWDELGKSAGYIRNRKIVDNCDHVVAFWDGKSRGTLNTIYLAKGKCTVIVY